MGVDFPQSGLIHSKKLCTEEGSSTSRLTRRQILPSHQGGKRIMAVQTAEKKAAVGFKPLKDRCFVSYTEELERTAGGIYIPDAAKEKPQRGKIEAVGADVKSVKVGDIVLFDKYSGSKIRTRTWVRSSCARSPRRRATWQAMERRRRPFWLRRSSARASKTLPPARIPWISSGESTRPWRPSLKS